jgi:sugar lactone lactonase YvrE
MDGKFVHSWQVAGHSDGMRIDPSTHLIWTTSCEDGNPKFATIDPTSNVVTSYTFPTPPHGGGYDDLYFLGGKTYVAASAPSLDANGNNPYPAIDQISIGSGKITLTPILMGNATATDSITKQQVSLTLTDPDSLSTDTNGNLVLVSQADNEIITISSPGTAAQKVTRLPVGNQLDDTVYATGKGKLLVTDGTSGFTYWIEANFPAGAIITQAPNDSGVTNFVGTVDPATGFVTPFAIGFGKATGMIFVPAA